MALKVIISGGGTGGHIYPGISLAYEIKGRDLNNDILFVGTERGLESKLVPREGFKIIKIKARGIKRKICFENLTAIVIFLISLFQSYKIIKKYKKFNLDSSKKTILVLGGSKGAASINRAVLGGIDLIKDATKNNWQVLLISGQDDYDNIMEIVGEDHKIFSVEPYLHDIQKAYSLADLVICRAGATTLAEISAYGLPAILIPYPYATQDHQGINAKIFEREGAAISILEKDLSGEKLGQVLLDLLKNKNQLGIMAKKSRGLSNVNSAKKIVDYISNYI
jgi:UDP-N-acetylglucosamine:LPS N-acetylglucosamine transferase